MSSTSQSYGARFATAGPSQRAELHLAEGKRDDFAAYDAALGRLLERAIRGEEVLDLQLAKRRTQTDVVTLRIDEEERTVLAAVLAPEAQQARGVWYLPESHKALLGLVEYGHWADVQPRFSISAADAQRASLALDTVDAIVIWAVLEPVLEALYLPIKLRSGYWLGDRRPDQMEKDWAAVQHTYSLLGVAQGPLELFVDGRRWAGLQIEEVVDARRQLMDAWRNAPEDVGARAIALLVDPLVERYYKKAKNGQAERTKVLNKGLERSLTAVYGGDWLAFLDYLGEQAHPAEKISTSVESTTLVVSGDQERREKAAAATGVPVEEIDAILSAYWGDAEGSPVEQRAEVMRRWWREFDEVHAAQSQEDPSRWGLIGDRFEDAMQSVEDGRFTPQAYRQLSAPLNEQIEQLWGTAVLPRWPEVLVSEPFPHAAFAEAFGPGASLWHEIALTCWFICEGPYSRTSVGGMPNYYEEQIKALEELGCPIDFDMFGELRDAEAKLTDRPPDPGDTHETDLGDGLTISVTMTVGPGKKDGFERLRNVVTRYRRAWAERHLESYLQARWGQDLRGTGDSYHRHVADKGRPPTRKQFAKLAAHGANLWFGGDLAALSSALRIPAPDPQERRRLLPHDRAAFVEEVRKTLGGQRWAQSANDLDRKERERLMRLSDLAERSPGVVQMWEAMGEPPPLKGNGWARYRLEAAFGSDLEAGWATYIQAIGTVLDGSRPTSSPSVDPEHAQPPNIAANGITNPTIETDEKSAQEGGVRGFLNRLRR